MGEELARAVAPRITRVVTDLRELPEYWVGQFQRWAVCEPPFQLAESFFAGAVWYWTDDDGTGVPAYGVVVLSRMTPVGRCRSAMILSEELVVQAVEHANARNQISLALVDRWVALR